MAGGNSNINSTGEKTSVDGFLAKFDRQVKSQINLAPYTTFKIGGPAELFAEIESVKDLVALVDAARAAAVPVIVLGGGSNVLIGDRGIDGLVIINRCRRLQKIGLKINVDAGLPLQELLDFAIENGLAGLEKMSGIPGTVGGAIIGNAGAYGQEISEVLNCIEVLTNDGGRGEVVSKKRAELGFAYRTSLLKSLPDIVLACEFDLQLAAIPALRQTAADVLARRNAKLPTQQASAGSFFKNIPDPEAPYGKVAAGRLLEEAGAKSLRVGSAVVSDQHANIIVNRGGATAAEVLKLAELMKNAVYKKFRVELEAEVRFLGKQ